MIHWPLLSLVTFVPLIGVFFILIARGDAAVVARNARFIALWTSLAVFALSVLLWVYFDPNTAAFQFIERANWITLGGFTIGYHMGIDGISLFFILLSTLLTFLSILSSWVVIRFQVREYMIAFLVLETFMVGIFCSLDFIQFYVFFEGVLIPMFLIIGLWKATTEFIRHSSLLVYVVGLGADAVGDSCNISADRITDIEYALNHANLFSFGLQKWLWLAFFASFAIKVPMWPLHTWLPDAHVEAPTAGPDILAGISLKLGGYGFLRFSLPMLPLASHFFTPLIFTLSVIAVIYTSLVELAQTDMKKLIAYSSIAHMGFVTMGISAVTAESLQGAIIQMLSHGFVSASLFFVRRCAYHRLHTHEIARFGDLVERMRPMPSCSWSLPWHRLPCRDSGLSANS